MNRLQVLFIMMLAWESIKPQCENWMKTYVAGQNESVKGDFVDFWLENLTFEEKHGKLSTVEQWQMSTVFYYCSFGESE